LRVSHLSNQEEDPMSPLIVVPVDGSSFSEAALPPALRMARRMGANLEIVTVHEPIPTLDYEVWESQAREWPEKYLEEMVEQLRNEDGVEISSKVLSGNAAEAIEDEVESVDASLVVMASHGRGAFSRVWLGSTSDALIRRATVPVLLVKPSEEGKDHADHPFEHMLVPMNGSSLSEKVLECAMQLGHVDGVRYTLVRVFPYPAEFASAYLPHTVQLNAQVIEEGKQEAKKYIEARAAELRAAGHEVDARLVVDANPAAGILHTAGDVGADIIAILKEYAVGLGTPELSRAYGISVEV